MLQLTTPSVLEQVSTSNYNNEVLHREDPVDLRMGDNTRPYQNGEAMEVNKLVKAVGTQLSRTLGRAVPAITQYTVTPWRGCSTQAAKTAAGSAQLTTISTVQDLYTLREYNAESGYVLKAKGVDKSVETGKLTRYSL